MTMTDDELLRYSRHILLPDIDVAGQERLKQSRVLIVGLGGLGSPVAMYLAASGIGHLCLADFDDVDVTNLQRQVVHSQTSVGMNKAESAKQALQGLNDQIAIHTIDHKIQSQEWDALIQPFDVIVDCTDNFDTRFAINAACYRQQVVLVSGAAIRFEGQLTVFNPKDNSSPCYQCLYSPDMTEALSCAEAGVLSPLVGVVGSLQALEVVKWISGAGDALVGRLVLFDAKAHQWRELKLPKDPHCAICGTVV
ncbi:Dinucleotide-utilizing enzymes involved in molybdopterin and thiamine biosynthesis family 2 [gamma proteobacterium IMCC1989]|nr:Dinucleotide-utilizing enzymes involved in molybdopterin and thiamine biosynthesis family 2 [gamma proteobacterium IMCC1989]